MKAVFFEPFAIYSPHFETCLELMQGQIDDGASVTLIGCDATLSACEPNPKHDLGICFRCICRRKQGLRSLEGWQSVEYISLDELLSASISECTYPKWNFSNINDLSQYNISGNDIGLAVASTLISLHRTPNPDIASCKDELDRFLSSAYAIYNSFNDYVSKNKVDKVYLFNGRFSFLRSVLRVCQQHGVDCYTHERGCNTNKYSVWHNTFPHDMAFFEKCLRESWSRALPEERKVVAEGFYHDRAEGKEQSWFSFTTDQTDGVLPDNWKTDKVNVVVFNSSEDEFAAIGPEWKNPIYNDQLDGIKKIVSGLSGRAEIHLYLRIHPNLKTVDNDSLTSLYKISSDNFTLIPAESKVSTYSLLRAADKVITFGSTVGIEAAFWGKVSILAGMSSYRNLGSVYLPENHDELINMVLADLSPKDPTGALMYGYFLNTFGVDFKYFEPDGLFYGRYKGKKTRLSLPVRLLSMASKIPILKLLFPGLIELVKK